MFVLREMSFAFVLLACVGELLEICIRLESLELRWLRVKLRLSIIERFIYMLLMHFIRDCRIDAQRLMHFLFLLGLGFCSFFLIISGMYNLDFFIWVRDSLVRFGFLTENRWDWSLWRFDIVCKRTYIFSIITITMNIFFRLQQLDIRGSWLILGFWVYGVRVGRDRLMGLFTIHVVIFCKAFLFEFYFFCLGLLYYKGL